MKEAILYQQLPERRVLCTACSRYCNIPEGKVGLCGIRANVDGKLQLLVYGKVIAGHVDPIEKKPVSHYMPGSKIFSVATSGCNWLCHPKGTTILMADGSQKMVESILPGDTLWSYEVDKGFKIVPSVVTHVGRRWAEIYEVSYGSSGHGGFCATKEHPVLTQRGWKEVGELKDGDTILKVWYQNTPTWHSKRSESIKNAVFTCAVCNAKVAGLAAWNAHRGECYVRGLEWTEEHLANVRNRMLTNNPMKETEYVRKMVKTSRERFLSDPSYGWHRNVDRLRTWLHRHPSEGQKHLYGLLEELGLSYQPEYKIKVEQRIPSSRSYYIADAALIEAKLDIEVDGWWHYNSPQVAENDKVRDQTLELNGWRVIRISGRHLFNHPEEVKALILERSAPVMRVNKRQWLPVQYLEQTKRFEEVYSLECIPNHNYVADGILVHNCHYCQNYDISQRRKVEGTDATPEEIVKMAKKYQADGIAYTYNEPTIFIEYAHDIGVIARKEGLINIFVSNGFMTPPAIAMMNDFLDCITVDFKGSGERDFVRKFIGIPSADPIFQNLLELKNKTEIHVEITDLIVPRVGDSLDSAKHLSKWVYDNLGPDTPIHFLRFHPDYKMMDFPWTPIETLVKHHGIAKEVGMNYAYIGNVPGHPLEHTYCPGCKQVVVQRYGYDILDWKMDKSNRCLNCGYKIAIVGSLSNSSRTIRFHPVTITRS